MTLASPRWAAELIHHWFHDLTPADWWGGSDQVDADLARRFAGEYHMLAGRMPETFLGDAQSAVAAVLLFDQVPRNIFRGTPRAFATDPLACAITHGALALGYAEALPRGEQRRFLAMPLMHSEDIADQELSLAYFRWLGLRGGLSFAREHHAMIARFGRFPHRNAIVGRKSTDAEVRAVAAGFAW